MTLKNEIGIWVGADVLLFVCTIFISTKSIMSEVAYILVIQQTLTHSHDIFILH